MARRPKQKIKDETAEHVADVLKAVAHPVRLKIVELLQHGEMSVNDITDAIGTKQSITSQQLNMMKSRGVLACRREGMKVYYRIENPNVIKLLHCVYDNCQDKGR